MRRVVQLGIIAFGIALGIGVGNRLSSEAMAVVVGVVCGVAASIPMSIMTLILTRRGSGSERPRASAPGAQGMPYPPVVVIQPDSRGSGNRFAPPAWDIPPAVEDQPWRRSFTVVGDEDNW